MSKWLLMLRYVQKRAAPKKAMAPGDYLMGVPKFIGTKKECEEAAPKIARMYAVATCDSAGIERVQQLLVYKWVVKMGYVLSSSSKEDRTMHIEFFLFPLASLYTTEELIDQ